MSPNASQSIKHIRVCLEKNDDNNKNLLHCMEEIASVGNHHDTHSIQTLTNHKHHWIYGLDSPTSQIITVIISMECRW